jgi:signal transduction histidine kinase
MKNNQTQIEDTCPECGANKRFFREVEIEFLIHELKDPVAIIETGLRTLLEKKEKFGPLSPRQEKILKRTLRNSHKARGMLNSLLEIGRSEAGCIFCCRFQPSKVTYSVLLEVLDSLFENISDRPSMFSEKEAKEAINFLHRKGIDFHISPTIINTEVKQDETKFQQIVGNLVKNALHFRKERVEVKLDLDNDYFLVDITDDGPGIDPAHHNIIFERYRQVNECSISPRSGHGLGLAGALIMARCLGGDIQLESVKGKGATFRLRLPVAFNNNRIETMM